MVSHDVRGVLRALVDRVPGAKTAVRRNGVLWLRELCNEVDALAPSTTVIDAIRDACSSCEYNPCMSHSEVQAAKAKMRLVHEWLRQVEGLRTSHRKASDR